jgi:hypothetical protein
MANSIAANVVRTVYLRRAVTTMMKMGRREWLMRGKLGRNGLRPYNGLLGWSGRN